MRRRDCFGSRVRDGNLRGCTALRLHDWRIGRPYDVAARRITPRGGADPAIFDTLVTELGRRRNRRHRGHRPLARRRRTATSATSAHQRDASRRIVALFRVERDGDRSAVHHARSRRGLRGDRRRGEARARVSRAAGCRACRNEDSVCGDPGAEAISRCGDVLPVFAKPSGLAARAAPRSSDRTSPGRRGGSTNTRCSARCMRVTRSARGPSGQNRFDHAMRRRSMLHAPSLRTRSSSASTCSGSRRTSGAPHAIEPGMSRCSAIYLLW